MDIKKIAVVKEKHFPNLINLDQSQPLAAIMKDLCEHWDLKDPENYALQWDQKKPCFVTERNRVEIVDGAIFKLTESPGKMVQSALEVLSKGPPDDLQMTLRKMADLAADNTYAQEFINKDGLQVLVNKIVEKISSPVTLGYALKTFVELMDHGIVSWDVLEPKFIKEVASSVNITKNTTADATTLQNALEILQCVVTHSTGASKYAAVEQEVTAVTLTDHLAKTKNPETQKWALALINALFLKADNTKRKKIAESIQSKSIRTIILNNVIRRTTLSAMSDVSAMSAGQPQIDSDMSHELYVLQSLLFNLLEERKLTRADPNDQSILNEIKELRRLAFDPEGHGESTIRRQNYVKDYKKLGFKNHANPVEDFMTAPPGVLALDNMAYFAQFHQEDYTKVVLENTTRADDHDLPFVEASIEMTRVLCDILNIGESPTEDGMVYYPMLFTHERPFEELFCHCINLLNKTWKEMRAAAADFSKVLGVAQEQITRAMNKSTDNFDRFHVHLMNLSYPELNKIWIQERKSKEEWESQARPIVELRQRIKPEILELIKQQRLNYLVDGSQFYNRLGRKGEKHWYCCLSPNHKVFYYGECDENVKPTIEQLKGKLNVVDIKRLLVGKECPHVNQKRKGHNTANVAFSIQTETEIEKDPLNFIAVDQHAYNMWTDGINALISNPMSSDLARSELEMLLSMEIKLRLLDTEGITIPDTPPPIPEQPPNYDFAYNTV